MNLENKLIDLRSNFSLRTGDYDPVSLMIKIVSRKQHTQHLFECLQRASPEILYSLLKYSNTDTWFASSIYEEMLKRYDVVSYILDAENNSNRREKLIQILLGLWIELRPINNEVLKTSSNIFREALSNKKSIRIVSLTCPAYTIGRESIAKNLIEDRVNFFTNLVKKSLGPINDLISQWDIYIWDPSNLSDVVLRKTIHPKLMSKPDLELQLNRNWKLFGSVAEKIHNKLGIKVICKKYLDLLPEIYTAKDILEDLEEKEKFHSKCLERILRHGREDYKKMGEDIEEHRDRFWNDSYIYTGAILKYGLEKDHSENLSLMLSIESRIHHITGLRLYHFEYGKKIYLMPVWNYPTWIRSFYWVNKGNKNVEQEILNTQDRWKRYEAWKNSWDKKTMVTS